jgi:amino acid transporter
MTNLLSLSYWFDMRPSGLHLSGILFFLLLILTFISIIFLFNIAKKRENNVYFKIWNGLNSFAITNLVVALFLLFFEYEEVYIFSARFWLLLWGVSTLFWLIFILRDYKKIPEIKKAYAKKEEFKRYIP